MNAHDKNVSELTFEQYLDSHELKNWDYEPIISGKNQRPDYRLLFKNMELFFEVKEFRQDSRQPLPQGGAYDPYVLIREKINAAREKFKNFREHCCSLVLYNVDALLVRLDDFTIMTGSMLGDLAMSFPVGVQTGTAVGGPAWSFSKRGKMIDYKHRQPQNTTISALIALTPLPLGRRRLEIETLRKESRLGRSMDPKEFLHFAESLEQRGFNSAETVVRVVVYENPYARIPLTREIFLGPYDERFGPDQDRFARVFAGTEIERLEEAERGVARTESQDL
jgi:hypothetical protein